MFYSLLFLTALLSQLHQGSSASTQFRVNDGDTTRPSIDALNNLVVIGDRAGSSDVGDVSFSFYSYDVSTANVISPDDYVQSKANDADGGNDDATLQTAASTDLAGNTFLGLGHDVAIADMNTVFVSQTSVAKQTGRVVLYEGNVTTFTQKQLLIPYDGKHRLDSAAAFGESIAATHDTLAVGCQNCNTSAPIYSGAVYVYKPNANNRWSEAQILTADGVMFLGEHVAAHNKVLVAAGDDSSGVALASQHNYGNVANTVVIYEEGPDGKYSQSQVITVKAGNTREMISGVTVFDETIAITTMGTDTNPSVSASEDKVYIYYPMNKRYGFSPKPKPHPQQWTNTQILASAGSNGDYRYGAGSPDTSISMNTLKYLTASEEGIVDKVGVATSTRSCLSCKFDTPTVVATPSNLNVTDRRVVMASDSSAFYLFSDTTVDLISDPVRNYVSTNKKCLTLSLQDQFNDGWGVASLVVTSPSGARDKFTLQCTTENPNVFSYCPDSMEKGIYNLHIENGKETPFGWEIVWKVATGTSWYVGDRDSHLFFNWDDKYEDFQFHDSKNLLPQYATCEICDPNKPAAKHRSLSNLRSLSHKGTTSSPTISSAPTITATGYNGYVWNEFVFVTGNPWFDNAYEGSAFFVSDKDGKHLVKTGTTCASGANQKCWVELPDGDYIVRVGDSIGGSGETYAFCESSRALAVNTELHFTVLDQQCYAGSFYELDNLCRNTYKSAFFLNIDVLLSGAVDLLSVSDESTLRVAVFETMLSVLGSMPSSASIMKQEVDNSGVKASLLVEFTSLPDTSALDNFISETSSASSLLKYELIGSQETASKFLQGEVSSVMITAASTNTGSRDYSKVDESSFQTVSDHVWKTNDVEPASNNFNAYAKYVSEGAYAVVGVAAVLAVSLFIKRSVGKKAGVEDNV